VKLYLNLNPAPLMSRRFAVAASLFWAGLLVTTFFFPPGGFWVTALFTALDSLFLLYYGKRAVFYNRMRADYERAVADRQARSRSYADMDRDAIRRNEER